MDETRTELLISQQKTADDALRQLTVDASVPEPGTPREAIIQQAIVNCETTRLAVLEDYQEQLRREP
jgi:hypothetical protein